MSMSPSLPSGKAQPKEAVIVAVYNQKGGCAKSQTTMQLSAALALRGKRVLVIDMDKQGTATKWSGQALPDKPFPATVVSLAAQSDRMIGEMKKFADMYDFIFIDCRPALDDSATWAVLHVADFGIIPVIPLLDNLWASTEAKDKGLSVKSGKNPSLRLFYLPSNVGRGNVYKIGVDALRSDEEMECFGTIISSRSSFPESQYLGASVHALGARAQAAINEIEALTDEFLSHVAV